MDSNKQLDSILRDLEFLGQKENKKTGFCIGNTRKVSTSGLFFTPIRHTEKLVAGSVIVYSVAQAEEIVNKIDGKVDYILVDSEKKISSELYKEDVGNIERKVRSVVKFSKIFTYKGNDLTVNSIDIILEQLFSDKKRGIGGKKASIIGAGNIGSKLALRLVERGVDVVMTRRDTAKLNSIVNALNLIKPKETLANITGTTDNLAASNGADILVALTSGKPVITREIINSLNKSAILMDAGKGCFSPKAIRLANREKITIYRPDIKIGFEGFTSSLFKTDTVIDSSIGRRLLKGVSVVSGLLGNLNEIIVDDYTKPQVVYGVADGYGEFIKVLNKSHLRDITIVTDEIKKRLKS